MEPPKRSFARALGRYGPELIVVFVGVWLSLLAEDWRQNRVDAATEIASLRRIAADLGADLADLRFNLERAESGVIGGLSLMGSNVGDDRTNRVGKRGQHFGRGRISRLVDRRLPGLFCIHSDPLPLASSISMARFSSRALPGRDSRSLRFSGLPSPRR